MISELRLLGPFSQLLTMSDLPERGPIATDQLVVVEMAGILIQAGYILELGNWESLRKAHPDAVIEEQTTESVVLPGLIDTHTHLCFAGSRAKDYSLRTAGKTYLEIAAAGGGIWSTVSATRSATDEELLQLMRKRYADVIEGGITTVEIKSGYGLSVDDELRHLRLINQLAQEADGTIVATCLAAHMVPKDFQGSPDAYLRMITQELFPIIQKEKLARRADIFIEKSAFTPQVAQPWLTKWKQLGMELTVHGDQFTSGGSRVAVDTGALSVDHLEASGPKEIEALGRADIVSTVLPGASIGLGIPFAPARALLDAGAKLAIASDWNPGSAPQGNLLMQAALLGAYEKLNAAEVWAGLTVRAAAALALTDRGVLVPGKRCDLTAFPVNDFREILYHQGRIKPVQTWIAAHKCL